MEGKDHKHNVMKLGRGRVETLGLRSGGKVWVGIGAEGS